MRTNHILLTRKLTENKHKFSNINFVYIKVVNILNVVTLD